MGILLIIFKIAKPIITKLWKVMLTLGKTAKGVGATKAGLGVTSFGVYSLIFTWEFAVCILVLIGIHEMGHVWAMKRFGMPTKGFYFIPFFGGAAVPETSFPTAYSEGYIALMGPIWGLFTSFGTYLIYIATSNPVFEVAACWMAFVNLINLLPIYPFDGGRVLHSFTYSYPMTRSEKIMMAIFSSAAIAFCVVNGYWLFAFFGVVGFFELASDYNKFHRMKKNQIEIETGEIEDIIRYLKRLLGLNDFADISEIPQAIDNMKESKDWQEFEQLKGLREQFSTWYQDWQEVWQEMLNDIGCHDKLYQKLTVCLIDKDPVSLMRKIIEKGQKRIKILGDSYVVSATDIYDIEHSHQEKLCDIDGDFWQSIAELCDQFKRIYNQAEQNLKSLYPKMSQFFKAAEVNSKQRFAGFPYKDSWSNFEVIIAYLNSDSERILIPKDTKIHEQDLAWYRPIRQYHLDQIKEINEVYFTFLIFEPEELDKIITRYNAIIANNEQDKPVLNIIGTKIKKMIGDSVKLLGLKKNAKIGDIFITIDNMKKQEKWREFEEIRKIRKDFSSWYKKWKKFWKQMKKNFDCGINNEFIICMLEDEPVKLIKQVLDDGKRVVKILDAEFGIEIHGYGLERAKEMEWDKYHIPDNYWQRLEILCSKFKEMYDQMESQLSTLYPKMKDLFTKHGIENNMKFNDFPSKDPWYNFEAVILYLASSKYHRLIPPTTRIHLDGCERKIEQHNMQHDEYSFAHLDTINETFFASLFIAPRVLDKLKDKYAVIADNSEIRLSFKQKAIVFGGYVILLIVLFTLMYVTGGSDAARGAVSFFKEF